VSFAAPFAFALAGLAALVVILYILKIKRRRVVVPYLQLWEQLVSETRAVTLFKRLKRLLSLLLQLAILAALILAVARPSFGLGGDKQKHVVLLLDASASMGAVEEGGKRRFDLLLAKARELVESRRPEDDWMVAAASDRIDVLTPFTKSTIRLRGALERAELTSRSLDVERATSFAREVTRGKGAPLLLVLSDGNAGAVKRAIEKDPSALLVPIGEARENVGIVRFSARKNQSLSTDYILAVVKNYGDKPRDVNLEFQLNGLTQKVIPKKLAPGAEETEKFQMRLPEGGTLQLKLGFDGAPADQPKDALAIDNAAFAIAYPDRLRRVILVTQTEAEAAPFKIAFEAMREVVDPSSGAITAEEYAKLKPEERQADVTICHNVLPEGIPNKGNLILIHTPIPNFVPATITGQDHEPTILDWDREHVLNRYLNYREMKVPPSNVLKLASGQTIVDGGDGPLLAAFDLPERRVLYVAFDMTSHLFPFRLAFPMLLRNTIAWFEAEEDLLFEESYAPGSVVVPLKRLAVDKVAARYFEGSRTEQTQELPVEQGRFRFEHTEAPGPVAFQIGDRLHATTVNLFDPQESSIAPDKPAGDTNIATGGGLRLGSGELWTYFALVGLLLWAIEWALYHRRVTE
jgi:hypothetical protein